MTGHRQRVAQQARHDHRQDGHDDPFSAVARVGVVADADGAIVAVVVRGEMVERPASAPDASQNLDRSQAAARPVGARATPVLGHEEHLATVRTAQPLPGVVQPPARLTASDLRGLFRLRKRDRGRRGRCSCRGVEALLTRGSCTAKSSYVSSDGLEHRIGVLVRNKVVADVFHGRRKVCLRELNI